MTDLAFMDLETVCLEPGDDVVWEIGLILRDSDKRLDGEWRWQVRPNVSKLSDWSRPDYEKRFCVPDGVGALCWNNLDTGGPGLPMTHKSVAAQVASLTHKRHIVGAVPDFDTWRLRFFMERYSDHGLLPSWHYHLRDVENLAVGYLLGLEEGRIRERAAQLDVFPSAVNASGSSGPAWIQPDGSWKSDDLYRAVGVNPAKYDRHTALGDCRLNRDVYDRISVPG